jgi:hypothetical protein
MYRLLVLFVSTLLTIELNAIPPLRVDLLGNTEPGYLFVATVGSGIGIIDNYSNSIDTTNLARLGRGFDLKIQANGALTFWSETAQKYYSLNSNYQVTDSFSISNQYHSDFHELLITSNGSYFVLGVANREVNMSQLVEDGKTNAIVADMVIEQYSSQKQLLFTWNSKDHVNIIETAVDDDLKSSFIKYIHINSIEEDTDGNLLLSCRSLDEVIKIKKSDGSIVWRLGGSKSKKNQFTFLNDIDENGFIGFSHQHDVRRLTNGNLLVFDNGNLKKTPKSRVVEYKINESAKTVEKVWEYAPNNSIYAYFMGSAQRMQNGNTVMCFLDKIIEADISSKTVYEAQFTNNDTPYRVKKHIHKMAGNTQFVTKSGIVDFNSFSNPTYLQLDISNIVSSVRVMVSRHNYLPPRDLKLKEGIPNKLLNYRWTLFSEMNTLSAKLSIDTRNLIGFNASDSMSIFWREKETEGDFIRLATTYNPVTRRIEANIEKGGEFIIGALYSIANLRPDLFLPRNAQADNINTILKWYQLVGSKSYDLQVSNVSNFSNLIVNTTNITSTSFSLNNLENGRSYFWRVRGKDANTYSQWSDVWTFKTYLKTPICLLPKQNEKRQLIDNVNLIWSKSPLSSSYEFQISEVDNFEKVLYYLNNITDTFKVVGGLEYRKKYYWRVRALDNEIPTEWSKVYSFNTEAKRPIITSPVNNQNGVTLKYKVDLDLTPETEFYQYQLNNDSIFTGINILTLPKINNLSLNLEEYKTYFLRVRSILHDDTTRWSEIIKFTTIINKPSLIYPYHYCLLVPMPTIFTMSFVQDAEGYEVNVKSQNEDKVLLKDTTFTMKTNSFEFDGVVKGSTNFWRARTVYKYGKSEWTNFNEFYVSTKGIVNSPALLFPLNNEQEVPLNGFLKWSPSGIDIESYRLIVSDNINFNTVLYDFSTKETEFYYKNLELNKTYYWRVAAFKDNEYSDWSEIRTFTTKDISAFTKPVLILPKQNESINNEKVSLIWEKIPSAIAYNLEVSKQIDFSSMVETQKNYPAVEFLLSKLLPNTTYYWRVQAIGQNDLSDWSSISSFITSDILSIEVDETIIENINIDDYDVIDVSGSKVYLYFKPKSFDELQEYLSTGVYFLVNYKYTSKVPIRFKVSK